MKTKFKILPLVLCLGLVAGLFSCEKKTDDTQTLGKLQISLALTDDDITLKSALSDTLNNDSIVYESYQLLLSVANINGQLVFEDKLIPLYRFGNGFVSEQIQMEVGDFYLEKFMVLDNYGQVLYASPLAGSPRAYLVKQPLPLFFYVKPEKTTQIAPEVLPVNGSTPSDFGYASFLVQVVQPVTFYIAAEIEYSSGILPEARIDLAFYNTPEDWYAGFTLSPGVNKLELRSLNMYQVTVYLNGQALQRHFISLEEVQQTSEDNPYIIRIGTEPLYHTLILQPGPEDGKDARITNLEPYMNFGDYKYFETTFLSEPILTVMRSTRSLIWFNMNQLPKSATIESVNLSLYYDIPIPWDENYFRSKGPWDSQFPWYGAALQQVIEPWEEYKLTWENQPKTTEMNQVFISPFIKNANFIDLDVTSLFVSDPNLDYPEYPNYGMMLRLYPEDVFPGFRFASSDYQDPAMRPKLTIKYSLPVPGSK